MSRLVNVYFKLISGKVHFLLVIFQIPGRKMPFSASSQNSISEKSISGHFEVSFLEIQNFSTVGVVICH